MTAVFYLSDVRYGGWPTFTAHLALSLQRAGDNSRIYKIGATTEGRARPFGRGLNYRNLKLAAAVEICRQIPAIVAVAAPKFIEPAVALLEAGATLVVHDPTELKGVGERLLGAARRVVVIRVANLNHIPGAVFIPHPYVPQPDPPEVDRDPLAAISVARVDWDKHTDEIVQANLTLPPALKVRLSGAVNRMYAHHKLLPVDPDWEQFLIPGPDGTDLYAQVSRLRHYGRAVDLSRIAGDGGGTQYTFLEAIDAGTELVLHTGWLTGDRKHDVMRPHATWVSGPEELAEQLSRPARLPDPAARALLKQHDPIVIGRRYLALS